MPLHPGLTSIFCPASPTPPRQGEQWVAISDDGPAKCCNLWSLALYEAEPCSLCCPPIADAGEEEEQAWAQPGGVGLGQSSVTAQNVQSEPSEPLAADSADLGESADSGATRERSGSQMTSFAVAFAGGLVASLLLLATTPV